MADTKPYDYTLTPSDKASPKFIFSFLLLHGLLFLGFEYIIFQSFPVFTLIHAIMGIGIYLIFWRASFPQLFQTVLIGAIISILLSIFFGDTILDNFFFLYKETPRGLVPQMYSAVVVFYIYFYTTLVKRAVLRGNKS